jgi:hypothetical protein
MEDIATLAVPAAEPVDQVLSDPGDEPLSDEELEALALAADPDAPLAEDAVPLDLGATSGLSLLPSWYMAPVVGRRLTKRRYRIAIAVLIGAFLLIDAFGLCATYGPISLA